MEDIELEKLSWSRTVPRVEDSESARKKEGTRLKHLRQQMDMTVRELAQEFNVAHSSISQWENGEHSIPGPVLKLMDIYERNLGSKKK